MSSITIDYDKLSIISKNASSASSRMNDYINDLTKRVVGKYGDITGGATSKTQSSEYYVNQKIAKLRTKKDQYSLFSTAVSALSTKAQEIDKDVATKIRASKDEFINKHDYISTDWWTDIKNWFIDLKNSCPLFNAIGQLIENAITGLKNLWADLKYWYKCGGGKEIVGVVLAIAGAIAAVVIFVCTLPVSGFVAACAAIGAAIAAFNAGWNVYTSFKALKAKNDGDPAWAKIYGKQDTIQDSLRQTNYHDGVLNKASYLFAAGIDVVQLVCDVVAIYDGIKKIKNVFKEIKISAQKGKVSLGKRFKQYLFNSDSYLKGSDGKAMKWRDIIQKRGDIRTLREYGVTKARTIDQYNKTLTKWQKFAKTMKKSKYVTIPKNLSKYGQKFFDYTLGGEGSFKKTLKDVWGGVNGKFKTTDAIDKLYNLKDKNWKSLKKDYKNLLGMKAPAIYGTGMGGR